MIVTYVALTNDLDRLGGLQLRFKSLIRGLIEKGFKVRLVQYHSAARGSEQFVRELSSPGFQILDIPNANDASPFSYLSSLKKASTKISKYGSDLIDSYEPIRPIKGIPFIYSSIFFLPYSVDMLLHFRFRISYYHLLKNIAEIRMINRPDGYIVEHTRNKSYLCSFHGIDSTKIRVIPYGYDMEMMKKIEIDRPNNMTNRIVFAGRLEDAKGISILLQAFRDLHTEYPDWRLTYIGDGPHGSRLHRRIVEMHLQEYVDMTGQLSQEETIKVIADSSIFVLPSLSEGLPSSIIQAMAAKIPVISTDVGGIGSDLIRNGINGILVKRGSASDLTEKLSKLIRDKELMKRIGTEGANSARGITVSRMIDDTIRFYDDIVAQKESRSL